MASRITKSERVTESAYSRYRKACAELLTAQTALEFNPNAGPVELAEVARLRRRAGAYRVQWETAARHLEELMEGAGL